MKNSLFIPKIRRSLWLGLISLIGLFLSTFVFASTPIVANQDAIVYCTDKGGIVRTRYPAYGTNDPTPLQLGGSQQFCEFKSTEDGSRISVALETLYNEQPTLAALAYLTQPSIPEIPTSVNPASVYCSHLGGTDLLGGKNSASGGWITDDTTAEDKVLEVCVFPDLSSIDSWGTIYHSNQTIRGKDLNTLFRYHPDKLPAVFAK